MPHGIFVCEFTPQPAQPRSRWADSNDAISENQSLREPHHATQVQFTAHREQTHTAPAAAEHTVTESHTENFSRISGKRGPRGAGVEPLQWSPTSRRGGRANAPRYPDIAPGHKRRRHGTNDIGKATNGSRRQQWRQQHQWRC
jgi:hypothetical protein